MSEPETIPAEPVTLLAFLDTETTGLHPHLGAEVWECGIIRAEHRPGRLVVLDEWCGQRQPWFLDKADPYALKIGGYWDRHFGPPVHLCNPLGEVVEHDPGTCHEPHAFAREIESRTRGRMMVGAVPSFDAGFLTPLLHEHGYPVGWHYQLVDIETLAAGYLAACLACEASGQIEPDEWPKPLGHRANLADLRPLAPPPWDSDALTGALGVSVEPHDRHTALGDARWAMETYAAVYGLQIDTEALKVSPPEEDPF